MIDKIISDLNFSLNGLLGTGDAPRQRCPFCNGTGYYLNQLSHDSSCRPCEGEGILGN